MRAPVVLTALVAALFALAAGAQASDCAYHSATTGLSRIVAVDSTEGPIYGRILTTKRNRIHNRSVTLRDREVILTFDDGPLPPITNTILDALDRHCVKATFFAVGRMAASNARTLREIDARGHTIGTHTWSHPRGMDTMAIEDIQYEIEMGFAAVSHALGKPIAPFFRFPGLRDSEAGVQYLATRNISTWTVDVVSGDTDPGATAETIANDTMARLRRLGRGILLFHDIKKATAEAIDTILYALRAEGFKVVHVVSNTSYQPDPKFQSPGDFVAVARRSFTGQSTRGEVTLVDGQVDYMHTEWIDLQRASQSHDAETDPKPVATLRDAVGSQALPGSISAGGGRPSVR
jgi:peptidoglycan/xylan/chitin deacetylase (PgdA/CDA1 family)